MCFLLREISRAFFPPYSFFREILLFSNNYVVMINVAKVHVKSSIAATKVLGPMLHDRGSGFRRTILENKYSSRSSGLIANRTL